MTELLVTELAARFWALAGEPGPFPRDLRRAICWALPLGVVELPRLRLATLGTWLERHGAAGELGAGDRPLRASLVALAGQGVIFLDGTDPDDEKRFSLAHEAAHFLADYWWSRERTARRVGDSALEVLDGRRAATRTERIDAALAGLRLRAYTHLMERTPSGHLPGAAVTRAERTADALALELLAPDEAVERVLAAERGDPRAALRRSFGLPDGTAALLARRRRPAESAGTGFLRRFGLVGPEVSHFDGALRKEE